MSLQPKTSVVIVNWNTRELLRNCLCSLMGDLRAARCEIIVVDNGSSDGSAAMVAEEFETVRLIQNADNRGFTAATNQGFAVATGEFVLLLNSDTEVAEAALRDSLAFMEASPGVGILGCRVDYPSGAPQSSCFRFPSLRAALLQALYLEQLFKHSKLFNWDRYGYDPFTETREVDCVMGSFMLVRVAAVVEEPLLDEGYFMYAEEADLCYRLKSAGWKVAFYPDARVAHHHMASSAGNPRTAAWAYQAKQRGTLRFLWKWRRLPVGYLANLVTLLGLVPRSIVWLLADVAAAVRERRAFRLARSFKAGAVRFHLAAACRPSLFGSSWAPVESVGTRSSEVRCAGAAGEDVD